MRMTAQQIFTTMRQAGFPSVVAVTMTAIALRESAGNPSAFNGNVATGDRSYGLLQINMLDPHVNAGVTKACGLTDEKQLLDPAINAKAGFFLWGGKNANLDVAWYIGRPGLNKDRYEHNLPIAQAAALEAIVS